MYPFDPLMTDPLDDFPVDWIECIDVFIDLLGPPTNFICHSLGNDLPLKLLPYLGNGHIGTQPNSPWIFLDGFFNGDTTMSHRACIPSPLHWKVSHLTSDGVNQIGCDEQLWMHFGSGLFTQRFICDQCELSCTTFISLHRPNLLIRYISAVFKSPCAQIHVHLDGNLSWDSADCVIDTNIVEGDILEIHGHTRIVESEKYQSGPLDFFMCTNMPGGALENGFLLTSSSPCRWFLTSISRVSMTHATEQYNSALQLSPTSLLTEQVLAWKTLWERGCVRLNLEPNQGRSPLSLMTHSAQYSLLTCLPSKVQPPFPNKPDCAFFGLCPTGLSRGNEEDDYMGHVFWDMEMWMLPWINLFHPVLCLMALNYRYATLGVAQDKAIANGLQGARYPWESAFTGVETTPWKLAADNQLHIIGAVSHAVQQWLIAHGDVEAPSFRWYQSKGRYLLEEVARFWYWRLNYSTDKRCFEIIDVMPPDEYTHCCRNSAYTNAIAASALAAPARFARLFNASVCREYEVWESASTQMWMPKDFTNKIMLEHEDYVLGTCVKQADTILLKYPLLYEQPSEWDRNMLDQYARVTDPHGPAMTWSMFCICALEMKNDEQATEYFERNLLHVQEPFMNWTETADGGGAVNFLTGAGGFLQSVVHGFAGIRIRLMPHRLFDSTCSNPSHHLVPTLHLYPRIPERSDWHSLCLNGLHFQSRRLKMEMLSKQHCILHLLSGAALQVSYKSDSGWVFERILSANEPRIEVEFKPLCLIPIKFVTDTNACSQSTVQS